MTRTATVAVLVGSLRKESFNRRMALALAEMARGTLDLRLIGIGTLPLYNQDLDATPPPEWTAFRDAVKACDALLFVTPEYNRSVPGVLKNALDVGSRPYGHSVWGGKPGAVISVSPGAMGGFGANHHLRQSLVFLDVPTMAQPEVYLGGAGSLFDAQGQIANEATRGFMQKFLDAYAAWVALQRKSA
ncbi:MAG: NAD(P)H-dependent oxidoreductase [Metallibacterium scheffleri]|jgi:chromate reductase|uniref:NADPH-dependent FMN reductase n=1 Tax=Metallibacterium scheffleri TaxID=993689 RepID=UPI0026EF8DC3|nr:NAD(P)H-dependent oxidoreductase [Metallibacterium scheffleri]MCK9365820.1 NAD(P)H-dependent oxidoreductase [Metallibacterium scheffleri]